MKFETRAVQTGVHKDSSYNSVTTPIYSTSIFFYDDIGKTRGYDYTRTDNPTRRALEENLAALEGGAGARVTASGMAAITTAMFLFRPGDHIIAPRDIYGGTHRLFTKVLAPMGYQFTFIDMRDPENARRAITPQTKCVWIETPSNPLLHVTDIATVAALAREAGLMTIADNTFLSPYFQRPLEMGVDIVAHSTTKYINGHSDIIGGAVVSRTQEHAKRLAYLTNALGTSGSPFDAWLQLRGVKTLPQRMDAHQRGAFAVAHFLEKHPRVKRVYFPGLPSHPQHELAKRQASGFGGIVTFDHDGDQAALSAFFKKLRIFLLSGSLGGVESLICQPWTMSHHAMPEADKLEAGITQSTVRVSIGIEHPDDLIEDLAQALER